MRLLPKQIWKEEFQYYSYKSVDDLKFEIQQLFDQSEGCDPSVNLTGKFISEYEFKMTPKWQFAIIQSFEREISFLKGRIFNDELRRTQVTFTVRPNSIFLIFFLLFPAIGVFALRSGDIEGDIDKIRFIGFIFIFIVPALMLLFGHLAKQGIKNRFIATFNLKPLSNRKEG